MTRRSASSARGRVLRRVPGHVPTHEVAVTDALRVRPLIEQLVQRTVPELLVEIGVGSISAAQLYCSWSHRGHLRNDAAFAVLGGAAAIPASSGQTVRYRLNRAGDRQLNCALHTIVLTRLQHDPATRAYAARRLAEGKTPREITRCLKRYLARHLYRLLETTGPHPTTPGRPPRSRTTGPCS